MLMFLRSTLPLLISLRAFNLLTVSIKLIIIISTKKKKKIAENLDLKINKLLSSTANCFCNSSLGQSSTGSSALVRASLRARLFSP
jgi:hypothetical protein